MDEKDLKHILEFCEYLENDGWFYDSELIRKLIKQFKELEEKIQDQRYEILNIKEKHDYEKNS